MRNKLKHVTVPIFLLFTFCFLLLLSNLMADDTWEKSYDPLKMWWCPGGYWVELSVTYYPEDICITQDGGYVVSGSAERWYIDQPPMFIDHWGFLMKTDSEGNLLWAKMDSVNFMSETDNYAFVETSEGDLISIGYSMSGGGYMIKRDAQGNRLWAMTYTDFGANSMCRLNDNNIVLAGVVNGNIAIRKIDNSGNEIWTKSYNLNATTISRSIVQAQNGDFLLTGTIYYDRVQKDIFVMKTDSQGDSLWSRTYDGFGGHDHGRSIIGTEDGNVLVGGYLQDSSSKDYHGFIWKLDEMGNTLWENIFGVDILTGILSVIQTQNNNYVLQGGKLVKINEEQEIIWIEELGGNEIGTGDKNLKELPNDGLLCVSGTIHTIIINKTDSTGHVNAIDDPNITNPDKIELYNYPNPFSSTTKIKLSLPMNIRNPDVEIYNIKGQRIKQYSIPDYSQTDELTVTWDGKDEKGEEVQNGIYFLKIKNGKCKKVRKITKIE